MAIRSLQFLGFRSAFRYGFPSPSSIRFYSPDFFDQLSDLSKPEFTHSPTISDQSVLQELSRLLHLDSNSTTPPDTSPEPLAPRVADDIITPVEKLRGVFLQKLTGSFAVESALSATGVDLTPEIFTGVVSRGNLGGAATITFFDWAIKQRGFPSSIGTYNTLIGALGKKKFFVFMEEVLFRMKTEGMKPDRDTVAIVLDCYVAARRVRKAVEMFDRLEEMYGSHDCESLAALVRSLCRWSHVRIAKSCLNKMRGRVQFDNVVYNEYIGGWAKAGRVDEVEGTMREMVADGLSPDSQTYGHLIEGLGRAGRIDEALILFEELEEKGCPPDVVTYGAMVCNFIHVEDLDKGIEVYKEMVERNFIPGCELYGKLICALLNERRVADSLEVFDEMLSNGVLPSTEMITSFIHSLCSYGPPHAAMLIYKKAKKAGCAISLKAYKLLLARLSWLGKCGTVLKVWQEMQEDGYRSDADVYGFIVQGLCNTGQLETAVLVLEESILNGFCIAGLIYNKLSNKLLKLNKTETAYKLLLKVREARQKANMQRIWRYKGWHF